MGEKEIRANGICCEKHGRNEGKHQNEAYSKANYHQMEDKNQAIEQSIKTCRCFHKPPILIK